MYNPESTGTVSWQSYMHHHQGWIAWPLKRQCSRHPKFNIFHQEMTPQRKLLRISPNRVRRICFLPTLGSLPSKGEQSALPWVWIEPTLDIAIISTPMGCKGGWIQGARRVAKGGKKLWKKMPVLCQEYMLFFCLPLSNQPRLKLLSTQQQGRAPSVCPPHLPHARARARPCCCVLKTLSLG